MTGTGRIRWTDESPEEFVTLAGRAGTRGEPAFRIFGPDAVNERWLLSVRLAAGSEFIYGDGPDELKAEAERWLEEFTSSLGAVFPDTGAVALLGAIFTDDPASPAPGEAG